MAHEFEVDGLLLSDDPARFDLDRAQAWIGVDSYWARGIPREVLARACANSLTVGVYGPEGDMRSMARVVTDRATFAWLADVYVDPAHRGSSLGKRMMDYVVGHPDLQGLRRWCLGTADAHGLYRQYGFTDLVAPDRWMERFDPEIYQR